MGDKIAGFSILCAVNTRTHPMGERGVSLVWCQFIEYGIGRLFKKVGVFGVVGGITGLFHCVPVSCFRQRSVCWVNAVCAGLFQRVPVWCFSVYLCSVSACTSVVYQRVPV